MSNRLYPYTGPPEEFHSIPSCDMQPDEEVSPGYTLEMPEAIWLDVREPFERDLCVIEPSMHIPLGDLQNRWAELDPHSPLIVYCHHGIRSLHAVHFLRAVGIQGAVSLAGGIDRWAREQDPAMPRY